MSKQRQNVDWLILGLISTTIIATSTAKLSHPPLAHKSNTCTTFITPHHSCYYSGLITAHPTTSSISILPKPISIAYTKGDESDEQFKVEKKDEEKNGKNIRVGSREYYSGFVSRRVEEEPSERVTGDAILIPTLKFAGGFAAILGGLILAFLASNGLL